MREPLKMNNLVNGRQKKKKIGPNYKRSNSYSKQKPEPFIMAVFFRSDMVLKLRSGLLMRKVQTIWLSKKVELLKTRLLRRFSAKSPAPSL